VCWTPDDGQRDCPKHVEFYSNNKFEKLVHFFGFIIRTVLACCIDLAMGWTSEELCSDYGQGHKISVFQLFMTTCGAEPSHLIGFCDCLMWVKQLVTATCCHRTPFARVKSDWNCAKTHTFLWPAEGQLLLYD